MKPNRWIATMVALAVVLCLPAAVAWAGPATCRSTSCYSAPGEIDPAGVQAWIAQNEIKGLTVDRWAAAAIAQPALNGALSVSKGDEIRPDAPATLWQAARLVMTWKQQPVANLTPREIAQKAADLKLMPGPVPAQDRPLTRLEAAQMVAGLAGFSGSAKPEVDLATVFADWSAVPPASRDLVYWVTVQYRLFVGYPDHTLRPGEVLTLGQMAVVAQRVQDLVLLASPPPLSEP